MPVVHHFMTLSSELYGTLCSIADERQVSLTDVITEALSQVVEEHRVGASRVAAEDALELPSLDTASLLMSYPPRFRSVH